MHVVRFIDDPGPIKSTLSDVAYPTECEAVNGSWCSGHVDEVRDAEMSPFEA